jgi:hypothetical protein
MSTSSGFSRVVLFLQIANFGQTLDYAIYQPAISLNMMMRLKGIGRNTSRGFGVAGHCLTLSNNRYILLFDRVKIIVKENIIFCLISKNLIQIYF